VYRQFERTGYLRRINIDSPTTVTIEASDKVILENDLNVWESEQFDRIINVISIEVDDSNITFESCRTLWAWRAGYANAGRGTLTLPRECVQCIYIDGHPVWGRPGA
jgi:hypothetical protein